MLGPHLLGRVPSTPDARDYRMGDYLAVTRSWGDADLSKPIFEAYQAGHLHTYADGLRLVRYLKAHHPAPTPTPTGVVTWHDGVVLDQGQTGHCVGFGWCGWGDSAPIEDSYTDADGHAVYYECKVIDGAPRDENGSSVRSGAKAMQNRGRVASYYFASSVDDVRAWARSHGPVVMGTTWTTGMFHPDGAGVVHPTGSVAGGHCYLLVGHDQASDVFEFVNSWGTAWGDNGHFFMHADDVATLLADQGEACAAVEHA